MAGSSADFVCSKIRFEWRISASADTLIWLFQIISSLSIPVGERTIYLIVHFKMKTAGGKSWADFEWALRSTEEIDWSTCLQTAVKCTFVFNYDWLLIYFVTLFLFPQRYGLNLLARIRKHQKIQRIVGPYLAFCSQVWPSNKPE